MTVPKDPVMLLSYLNTKLRDQYANLEELCMACDLNCQEICSKLESIDYVYDAAQNQFI